MPGRRGAGAPRLARALPLALPLALALALALAGAQEPARPPSPAAEGDGEPVRAPPAAAVKDYEDWLAYRRPPEAWECDALFYGAGDGCESRPAHACTAGTDAANTQQVRLRVRGGGPGLRATAPRRGRGPRGHALGLRGRRALRRGRVRAPAGADGPLLQGREAVRAERRRARRRERLHASRRGAEGHAVPRAVRPAPRAERPLGGLGLQGAAGGGAVRRDGDPPGLRGAQSRQPGGQAGRGEAEGPRGDEGTVRGEGAVRGPALPAREPRHLHRHQRGGGPGGRGGEGAAVPEHPRRARRRRLRGEPRVSLAAGGERRRHARLVRRGGGAAGGARRLARETDAPAQLPVDGELPGPAPGGNARERPQQPRLLRGRGRQRQGRSALAPRAQVEPRTDARSKFVVTAAHCMFGDAKRGDPVLIGHNRLSNAESCCGRSELRRIAKITMHPK